MNIIYWSKSAGPDLKTKIENLVCSHSKIISIVPVVYKKDGDCMDLVEACIIYKYYVCKS